MNPVYVRVGVDAEQVLLMFSSDPVGGEPAEISQWRIDPAQCLDIIEAMARSAFEADNKLKPVGDVAKSQIIEKTRMKLTSRFAVMLSTLRPDKMKSDGQVAQDLVDVALKEVY